MKDFRFYFTAMLLVASVFLILSPLVLRKTGVVVTSVRGNDCGELTEGDAVTQIAGVVVRDLNEFNSFAANVKANTYYPMVVNNGPGGCRALADGYIGIDVADMETRGLRFERSIGGGVEMTYVPTAALPDEKLENELEESKRIVQARMQILGMADGEVEIKSGTKSGGEGDVWLKDWRLVVSSSPNNNLGLLVKRGRIEGVIRQPLEVRSGKAELKIGNARYGIDVADAVNGKVIANGSEIGVGGKFYLENAEFTLVNATNTSLVLDSLVFGNENIVRALPSYGGISSEPAANLYRFNFPIELDKKSGERFGSVSDGLGTVVAGTQASLNGVLAFYVDGKKISELGIPLEIAGTNISTISIMGFGKDASEAAAKKTLVELAAAGSLPFEFRMERTASIEPRNGWLIFLVPMFAAALSAAGLVAHKFSNLKIVRSTTGLIVSESVFAFGAFAFAQNFTSWLIDAYALVGVCAFLSINAFDAIVAYKSKVWKRGVIEKLKIALFVVGFASLFTPARGLGISLITGLALNHFVTKPFFKSMV